MNAQFQYINTFPNPEDFAATEKEWNDKYGNSNTLIDCTAKEIYYPLHWTPLSIKLCFTGTEFYQSKNGIKYAVDNSNYLIYNEGCEYESYIKTLKETTSVSLNFSKAFINSAFRSLTDSNSCLDIADVSEIKLDQLPFFYEQLYVPRKTLLEMIERVRFYMKVGQSEIIKVEELFYLIFKELITEQEHLSARITEVDKVKYSTKVEIFKRLHQAKDYINSCYYQNIQLEDLSKITLLNEFYLLRLFKTYFKLTPHQFLTQRRIEVSKKLLKEGYSVTDTCKMVGYADVASFGKLFKKNTGEVPKKFR